MTDLQFDSIRIILLLILAVTFGIYVSLVIIIARLRRK